MIESLRIENVAIVEEAQLEFGPGLNVLTGETGAGKSIVLGALSLLVGARAQRDSVREGAEQGAVEALFRTDALAQLEAELRALDLLPGADGEVDAHGEAHELVVRRSLAAGGRSRARMGGQLVPVATLAEILGGRVEISSQHASQALLRPEAHGRYLDAAGGLEGAREAVAREFEALRALDDECARLAAEAEERLRQQDFLTFQLGEIEEVGLEPGELDALDQEHSRLAHAETLRAEGGQALASLCGDDSGAASAGATDAVARALRGAEAMVKHDPGLASWLERLEALDAELRDLSADLERYLDGVEGDPARLGALEERIAQVERLRRKYGSGEEEIFAQRDRLERERASVEGADDRLAELRGQRPGRVAALTEAAAKLSAGREKAARKLSREVQRSLAGLGMPDGRFQVKFAPPAQAGQWPTDATSGPSGAEAPEFCFSANKGEAPRPLQKVASGGELSRVFLALKGALRGAGSPMVLVFDEVDAGIGGRAAERVGRALAELAQRHQVLCITHLPQIAVFANRHFRVEKTEARRRVRARIVPLDADGRVEEIARMAGGEAISDATRAHARELLAGVTPG